MPHLIWTAKASADLQRLYRFLASKDPDAARSAVKTIRAAVKILGHFPHIGRPAEEMGPEFREWPIGFGSGGYVVLYRVDGDRVALVAVRHAREAGYQ